MAASVVDTSFWIKFFVDAGIPSVEATAYAIKFTDNRIQKSMLLDLNKDYLNDMGISCLGDIIAILKHAKAFHDKILRERTLEKIDGPQDAVKIAAVSAATRQVAPSSTPAASVSALPQQSAGARIQAAAAPIERPRITAVESAAAASVAIAAKPSSASATATAAVASRQSLAGASTSARKAVGRSPGSHSDRVSGMPASAAEEPETVTDQDGDECSDAQSDAGAAPPRPHRAVLAPRKRSSTGSGPPVNSKKRLGSANSESAPSSGSAPAVCPKPGTASGPVKSSRVVAATSAGSQTSIFSRLGSAGAGASDGTASSEPRVTVTGLGKAQLLRKPDIPNQVVKLKCPSTGTDALNGSRRSGTLSDDAKAAARMLIATARSATASTAAARQDQLTGDPEVAAATTVPKKHVGALRTVVGVGKRASVGSMTADSPLLRQDAKHRLGMAAGDGPSARAESGGKARARTVARIVSARGATATGEFATDGVVSRQSSTVVGTVLSRVGSAASGPGSSATRRPTSLESSDDLRKRIGSSAKAAPVVDSSDGGSARPLQRGSVFSRLGGGSL